MVARYVGCIDARRCRKSCHQSPAYSLLTMTPPPIAKYLHFGMFMMMQRSENVYNYRSISCYEAVRHLCLRNQSINITQRDAIDFYASTFTFETFN